MTVLAIIMMPVLTIVVFAVGFVAGFLIGANT